MTRLCNFLQLRNSSAERAREVLEPSTDSASLLVYFSKKFCFVLVLGFSVGDIISAACFSRFYGDFVAEVT